MTQARTADEARRRTLLCWVAPPMHATADDATRAVRTTSLVAASR